MLRKKVTIVNKAGTVVREPNMEAMKLWDEKKPANESDADEEDGEVRGEAPLG